MQRIMEFLIIIIEKKSEGYTLQACHCINVEYDIINWIPVFEVGLRLLKLGLLQEEQKLDFG